MLLLLQTLQISLFAIPVMSLSIIGILILIKPVLILHRRFFLLAFVPFLLANSLALVEPDALSGTGPSLGWRFGLVLALDLALVLGGTWLSTGWLIYGLTQAETEHALKSWFEDREWVWDAQDAEKNTWWGGSRQTRCLQARSGDQTLAFWLIRLGNELRLAAETPKAARQLRKALPKLHQVEKAYRIQDHLAGVLYLVLAMVLAVLGWIFFFEPRIILIE